jgi:hypothetical protein
MRDIAASETVAGVRHPRGMRLSTLMIVVAVVAVCSTLATLAPARLLQRIESALPVLAGATLALVAYRLWPPRPPLDRLMGEPGFLACGVASIMLVGAAAGSLVLGLVWRVASGTTAPSLARALLDSLADWSYLVGLAVLVAWIVLGVVRGWKAEKTVADRTGRAIGWAWVLLAPAGMVLRLMIVLKVLAG